MPETTPTPRDIGIDVPAPQGTCTRPNCPFHGHLKVRGAQIVGRVTSLAMQRTALIERKYNHYVPKYERYERRTSKYSAHVPQCLGVQEGDEVRIMECRPLSKSVQFVVVERRASQ